MRTIPLFLCVILGTWMNCNCDPIPEKPISKEGYVKIRVLGGSIQNSHEDFIVGDVDFVKEVRCIADYYSRDLTFWKKVFSTATKQSEISEYPVSSCRICNDLSKIIVILHNEGHKHPPRLIFGCNNFEVADLFFDSTGYKISFEKEVSSFLESSLNKLRADACGKHSDTGCSGVWDAP